MGRARDPRGAPPFLTEQAAWDSLADLLAGRISFPRPDNAPPIRLPERWADFRLMHEMGWSWQDLQATPLGVQRDMLRCLDAVNAGQQERQDKASGAAPKGVPIDLAALQAAQPDYYPPE